ncbi:hypothetical protein R0137_09755 [Congregibacter brevis]|uniref:Uncharacterized protein n=1 Tax=Congregibacter brevis TaxID=3081201 RepID=A0ABZ0IAH7_9GAMM|nr:hypothetical protein R0137_09755 [Congregibacter sp. IMCC45268]
MKHGTKDPLERICESFNVGLAVNHFEAYGDPSKLEALGLSHELLEVRRRASRPKALAMNPEHVVQLVWKAMLQEGCEFSGKENNPCFKHVAKAQGASVSSVLRAWKRVPATRRREIRDWLYSVLEAEVGKPNVKNKLHRDYVLGKRKLRK